MAQMRNKQNLDFIDALVDSFEKRIKELLDTGKYDIDEAVDIAYKEYPVMQEMQKWLQDELVKVASDGYGKKLPKNAQESLLKPWAVDELSLSDRTTAKKKSVLRAVKKELRAGINKSKNYEDVALSIFDGYKHGGVIPKQDIAKYLDRLTKLSSLDKEDKLFKQEMRKAERQIKNIKTGGLKAAYNQVAKMVETNREKAIEKAVYVGTQEKTRYFARRIARTELARAWHEGFIAKYNQDDDIVAYKWKLSSSHPVFDICDFYANADLYGLGKGVFPKNKVPILPAHPHCMCRLMPIVKGMIDNDEPKDNIEQGGRDYIESLTDIEKKQLLGIKGTNKFSKGESWQNYLRNYKTDTFKNRISIEKSENKTYNEPIKRLNLETASVHDVINQGKLINEKYKIHEHVGDIDRLKEILSKFTTLTTEIPKDIWAAKNIKANMEVLSDAFKCYPKAWLDYLKDNKVKLYTRKAKRGFFNSGAVKGNSYYDWNVEGDYKKDYVTINLDSKDIRAFTTAIHEIGHFVEHFNPQILKLSKEFLEYRTKGEPLRSLNAIYSYRTIYEKDEVARADDFISPYIGKDYDDGTEVLSMGLEGIFTNRDYIKRYDYDKQLRKYVPNKKKITDDKEYLNFIIGILFNS